MSEIAFGALIKLPSGEDSKYPRLFICPFLVNVRCFYRVWHNSGWRVEDRLDKMDVL